MKIDFHTHIFTRSYLDELEKRKKYPYINSSNPEELLLSSNSKLRIGDAFRNPATRIGDMDKHGIDISVLSPPNPWSDIFTENEAITVCKRVNDELASIIRSSRKRFVGLGILPLRSVEEAIVELNRIVAELGLKGVIVGPTIGSDSLADKKFLPILREASRLNVAILIHPSSANFGGLIWEPYLNAVVGYPIETSVHLSKMILAGILIKLPNLKLVISHQGAALPSLIGRMDQAYEDFEGWKELLPSPPSEYLKMMFVDTVSYDPLILELALRFFGSKKLIFGSDYPFPLGGGANSPSTVTEVIESLNLSKEVSDEIYFENASRLLGIS